MQSPLPTPSAVRTSTGTRPSALPRAQRPLRVVLLATAAAVLAACGGGGGGGPAEPPDPVLSLAENTVLDSDGLLRMTVSVLARPGVDASTPLTLTYAASDLQTGTGYARGGSSCSEGVDYLRPADGASVTLSAGSSSAVLSITLCPNSGFEPNEQLLVSVGVKGRSLASARATLLNTRAGGLNDTGINSCADASGNPMACSATTLPGQDAQRGRDAQALSRGDADGALGFAYAKVGSAGEALAAGSADWSCVQDQVSGLLWQADTAAPTLWAWADVAAQVAAANANNRCGRNNWRLPQPEELGGLVHAGRSTGLALDADWWRDAGTWASGASAPYWTAGQWPDDSNTAVVLDFALGVLGPRNKAAANRAAVRLVSGTAPAAAPASVCDESNTGSSDPAGRFVLHGDGSATDSRTGLMWLRCSLGQSGERCASGTASLLNWSQALAQAAQFNGETGPALGRLHGDWRLPNRNELASLVERSCRKPAINRVVFPATALGSWWSSSPVPRLPGMAWSSDFVDGDLGPAEVSGTRMVRLVRGGQ